MEELKEIRNKVEEQNNKLFNALQNWNKTIKVFKKYVQNEVFCALTKERQIEITDKIEKNVQLCHEQLMELGINSLDYGLEEIKYEPTK